VRLNDSLTFLFCATLLALACSDSKGGADDDEGNQAGTGGDGGSTSSGGNGGTGGVSSGGTGGTGGQGGGTSGGAGGVVSSGGTGGSVGGSGGTGGSLGGSGGSSGVPATCTVPPTVTGQLANPVAAVDYAGEVAEVDVVHKIDVDVAEDGCISSVLIVLDKGGQGCEVSLYYSTNGDSTALELSNASFTADSFCPGWTDADEGAYDYLISQSGAVLNITSRVPDRTAETSCFTTSLQLAGTVTLERFDDGRQLEFDLSGINIAGDFQSTGDAEATCPVVPVGTGGAGGGAGAGGAGGTGGTGGAGTGGGGTGGTPTTAIVAYDGWVAPGSNTVGIVGPWYFFYDTYSSIFPLPGGVDFTGAGNEICVQGTTSQSDEYGPTVALSFNQPEGEAEGLGYIPADHGVTGFSFGFTGTPLPGSVQITYAALDGSQFCRVITASSSQTLLIADTIQDCWNGTGTAASTSTAYQAIQFQLPVNYYSEGQAFNYCITNLTAITN